MAESSVARQFPVLYAGEVSRLEVFRKAREEEPESE